MHKLFIGIKNYLSDWKNWLTHSIVGILLLIIAIFAPVNIYLKIIFILGVISFNVIRMKYFGD